MHEIIGNFLLLVFVLFQLIQNFVVDICALMFVVTT